MTSLIQLVAFSRAWDRHGLTDEDLQALESTLLANPEAGPVVAGTGGVRKVRFAPPSRHTGKSGAFRVAYAYVQIAGTIYLLTMFGKSEQANLTAAQKGELRQLMKALTDVHRPTE